DEGGIRDRNVTGVHTCALPICPGISYPGKIVITAIEQLTIVIVLPDKWMVAPSGTTKSAIRARMPFSFVRANVTGIVAALDIVRSEERRARSERLRVQGVSV